MKAFSLIELIIYLALFTLLMTGTLAGAASLAASAGRNDTRAELEQEGSFIIEKIRYELTEGTLLLTNPSSLALKDSNGQTTIFDIEDGTLWITRASDEPLPLTDTNITVGDFSIAESGAGTGSSPTAISISFTLSAPSPGGGAISASFNQTFYPDP